MSRMESMGAFSNPTIPKPQLYPILQFSGKFSSSLKTQQIKRRQNTFTRIRPLCCSNFTPVPAPQIEFVEENALAAAAKGIPPPRTRYRKLYPGEKDGITEEMRFIAMKLRNSGKPKIRARRRKINDKNSEELVNVSFQSDDNVEKRDEDSMSQEEKDGDSNRDGNVETWEPTMEGFLKYLVDSKLVFNTVEHIVDESHDVSYAYFRKTGLERVECLSKDLEWLRQEGNLIPEPSNPGITYSKYVEELGEKSPSLFLCHLYNIYFSHIAGGQLIAKKICNNLLKGGELEFCRWEGEEEELLRAMREKLNMVGEHWSRYVKNQCLREATKAFRFLGQIVRLTVL